MLLVEDDPVIGEATQLHLERNGYVVVRSTDGLEAWDRWRTDGPFDVVLTDVMLPGLDGVTLCRRIRADGDTPVVLVSARTDAVDVVLGLEAGADDYVSKPFDVQVLLARLRSVARRARPAPAAASTGNRRADGAVRRPRARPGRARGATCRSTGVADPDRDAAAARAARTLPGSCCAGPTLLQRVWDYGEWADDHHLVDVHVQRLRAKIGAGRIETVRGFGFKLRR